MRSIPEKNANCRKIEEITISDAMTTPGLAFALCNKEKVFPFPADTIYHGAADGSPETVAYIMRNGLQSRGTNIELLDHAEGKERNGISAFRGATRKYHPGNPPGAWDWAGEGGVVYRIEDYPGYELGLLFQEVPEDVKLGYGLQLGENETTIPARVPASFITKYGYLLRDGQGRPRWKWDK